MDAGATATLTTECRQCCAFCDKLIEPRGCLERGCHSLYAYTDAASGRRFMGCLHKVFRVEIDTDLFEQAEGCSRRGFGGVKAAAEPFPHCPFTTERSYEGAGDAFACTNPRFLDCSERPPAGIRVFDLRA